jgi:hypothetical protein
VFIVIFGQELAQKVILFESFSKSGKELPKDFNQRWLAAAKMGWQ